MDLEQRIAEHVKAYCLLSHGEKMKFRKERNSGYSAAEWILFVRYWQQLEKEQYQIPELIGKKDIQEHLGVGVYTALDVPLGNPSQLLRKVFDEYGVLDAEKCAVFVEKKDLGSRHLLAGAFFADENKEANAKQLMHYVWNKTWKEQYQIPELIGHKDIVEHLGDGVYSALDINPGNPSQLLRKVFDEYGVLTVEKVDILLGKKGSKKRDLEKIFFNDNSNLEDNIQIYLECYQQKQQKRLGELTEAEIARFPTAVKTYLGTMEQQAHKKQPKRESTYHQIQIHWTDALEAKLKQLFAEHDDNLFEDKNLLWQELGVTTFAARMKAAALQLIPAVNFSNVLAQRLASYPLLLYPHYQTVDDYLTAAETLPVRKKIDIEGFSSPVHQQGFHVQLPIFYKGIGMNNYTEQEQAVIQVLATYLANPAAFSREKDRENLPVFKAPDELDHPHTLVPLRIGNREEDDMLVKLYLPKTYAQDPGGVFTSVLEHQDLRLFFFYHKSTGVVA